MTLPSSGGLTIAEILEEIGDSFPVTIPNANWRTLAGKPTGSLVIPTDFYGKSWRSVSLVDTSSSASESVSYGASRSDRWIVILAVGGDASSAYNLACTISGVPANVIVRHSSGTGAGTATGTAIFTGQPSGTSGTVTITGTTTMRFYVLRVTGYDCSAAVFSDDSAGSGIPPWSATVPANGLCLGIVQNSNGNAISWTGLTERISDAALISGKTSSAAWDVNMSASGAKAVSVTASDVDGVTSACVATFAPI